ncbi:MAG: D-alanyl-D-alanine carboxypeptidase/D-alanyl-D-alanine-endopeptidase [Chitinophagales bacterium]
MLITRFPSLFPISTFSGSFFSAQIISKRVLIFFLFVSCTSQKNLSSDQRSIDILQSPALNGALAGICVYDPEKKNYLYQFQDDKYFVPASNTKLFSLYAGMKYLGDSLPGILYLETDTAIILIPTGDPSFLHPDFPDQPVFRFLKHQRKNIYVFDSNWKTTAWGSGWSWDDYNDDYMAERSALPVYGNLIRWVQQTQQKANAETQFDSSPSIYSIPEVDWKVRFSTDTQSRKFLVKRHLFENVFEVNEGLEKNAEQLVPFITNGSTSAIMLLKDTLGQNIFPVNPDSRLGKKLLGINPALFTIIHSRPVDSLFRPLMFKSDNFFAEQILLMVSQQKLGLMNEEKIIDSILKTDLAGLPQKPNWADGSGLSRYNLFSPQDFVWLLDKMQKEFGLERMERLLPTGGNGTLSKYFKQDSGYIFAKTGSLSDVITLSGYLLTKKNHLLIFSVLLNNSLGKGSDIRRTVEKFLEQVREKN